MSWENRQRKRRRACRHHKYKFVSRRRTNAGSYYVFVCTSGNHQALFQISQWWGPKQQEYTL